jgi:seryl-tRNA synthetase
MKAAPRHSAAMHDIRFIRDHPAAFDAGLARRGLAAQSGAILALDETWRGLAHRLQTALARRNDASKAIGAAMGRKEFDEAERLKTEVSSLKDEIATLEEQERSAQAVVQDLLAAIPNIPADDVPVGSDESGNQEVKRWGQVRTFESDPKEHFDLGPPLGLDFETGAKLSGARFTVVRGQLAKLHRALGQFGLDVLTGTHGYEEVVPPVLVRDEAMFGTGQLPKFADDSFKTTDGRWLIPTSEVSLTNMVSGDILAAADLPLRFVALTSCFRSEAGSAGRDTRGYIRQHQFEKVEMVSITPPDQSEAEHERMTACAEDVLQRLDIPYRRMKLCSGDMGFTSVRTFDLEVWLPGQGQYREISSCSTCGDFQARRMNTRYRPEGEKRTDFVHTLNGSGLVVGRMIVAILENYQNGDGSITVPDVLRPYLGGLESLIPA